MKSKLMKVIALLLVCLMLVSVASCGQSGGETTPADDKGSETPGGSDTQPSGSDTKPSGDDAQPSDGSGITDGVLDVAIVSDSGTLDPAIMTGGGFAAVACCMEPLWDTTLDNQVIYVLAESVDQVSDMEYIVHLRQGVKFSNGNPLTASDVVFSIKQHYAAGATGMPRVQTVDPDKTVAIDDNTLDMWLLAPSIAHFTILSQMLVYDEESYDPANAATNPIGTGPYVVTEYTPNSIIKVERKDDYWGEAPNMKTINFRVLAESSQRINALETGLVDVAAVPTSDVDYVSTLPGIKVEGNYSGMYCSINFNHGENSAFYRNVDARSAVAHAIDPNAVLNVVYLGKGYVMHAAVPDYCFDYEDRFTDMDETYAKGYDPELAKELAEKSGLTSRPLKLMTDGTETASKTAEIVQNMLKEIGVTVEINNYDPATVWQMQYDPAADYDFSIGNGIAPNRRVGDLLLNGVRYSPQLVIPGAFENNEAYLEKAPECMSTLDEKALSDLLFDMLGQYERSVLSFALCDYQSFTAFSSDIDMSTALQTFGTAGVRFVDLRLAG